MRITKHAHACVLLEDRGREILIDPGAFTANAGELIDQASTVLITHEHVDHFDEALLTAALEHREDLQIWGPAAVTARWDDRYPTQVHTVHDGDRFLANGLSVAVHGDVHAQIHAGIPRVPNVGYLVQGAVYHPGDAYHVPPAEVDTLLLPTSGPWTKLGQAVDYVRAVQPKSIIQIHELMLSELGQRSTANFLGLSILGGFALTLMPAGESREL